MSEASLSETPRGRHFVALGLVLLLAAGLRFYWNDIEHYSPADEAHYLRDARALVSPTARR